MASRVSGSSGSAIAGELISQLATIVETFEGITVLDVGFGYGFNAKAMSAEGARVFGVEPNEEAFNHAIQNQLLEKDLAFYGRLQDMPEELVNDSGVVTKKFDMVTVFLWNISWSEYDDVLEACSRKIARGGKMIIGIHDQLYVTDRHGCAVMPHVQRYFDQVEMKVFPGKWNGYVVVAQTVKARDVW